MWKSIFGSLSASRENRWVDSWAKLQVPNFGRNFQLQPHHAQLSSHQLQPDNFVLFTAVQTGAISVKVAEWFNSIHSPIDLLAVDSSSTLHPVNIEHSTDVVWIKFEFFKSKSTVRQLLVIQPAEQTPAGTRITFLLSWRVYELNTRRPVPSNDVAHRSITRKWRRPNEIIRPCSCLLLSSSTNDDGESRGPFPCSALDDCNAAACNEQ